MNNKVCADRERLVMISKDIAQPMAQYTKLQEGEVHALAREFGLQITDYLPIAGGAANSSYLLNNGTDRYVLTVCDNNPAHVEHMSQVMLLLEEHDFPAPRIKPLLNGKHLAAYQGKPVLLKPFITGKIIESLTCTHLHQIGIAMARLHEIPAPDYLPQTHTYISDTIPCVLKQGRDQTYLNWLKKRYNFIKFSIPSNLPRGLIHGDLFFDNILFEAGQLKAFLDFEDVCHSYKMFDVGMAVVGLCTHETHLLLEKIRAFVDGYQTVRKLSEAEKESLILFIELSALLTSAWRYWKYHLDAPDASKAQKHLQMVNIAKGAQAMPQEVWMKTIFV